MATWIRKGDHNACRWMGPWAALRQGQEKGLAHLLIVVVDREQGAGCRAWKGEGSGRDWWGMKLGVIVGGQTEREGSRRVGHHVGPTWRHRNSRGEGFRERANRRKLSWRSRGRRLRTELPRTTLSCTELARTALTRTALSRWTALSRQTTLLWTEGLGRSRGGDWAWIDDTRADTLGKGEGIVERMTVARLFPSTDDADTRMHGGGRQTKAIVARRKCPSSSLFSCMTKYDHIYSLISL